MRDLDGWIDLLFTRLFPLTRLIFTFPLAFLALPLPITFTFPRFPLDQDLSQTSNLGMSRLKDIIFVQRMTSFDSRRIKGMKKGWDVCSKCCSSEGNE